jgi:septal ring factor EnvC (AmiA/AmiB activator)
MSDYSLKSGSSSSAPDSDFPADVAHVGLPVHSFVSLVEVQPIFDQLRSENVDLKTELSKTSKDLSQVSNKLLAMTEENKKLDDQLKIAQLDKQTLKEELRSAKEELSHCIHTNSRPRHELETLIEAKRGLELSNAKLVDEDTEWCHNTHAEQILLQARMNDFKKQQVFFAETERLILEKRFKLETREEQALKKEKDLNRRAKEMEKKYSKFIDLKVLQKHLEEKEKYLTEWSFDLTSMQEAADEETLALRRKEEELRELEKDILESNPGMKLSQERLLKFTSECSMSAMAASPSSDKSSSSGSDSTIKASTKVCLFPTFFFQRLLTKK